VGTNTHAFKLAEARRLFKAAVEAGLKPKGVTLRDGEPYVEIDNAPETDGEAAQHIRARG
jgi:hypothetical protein